MAHSSIEEQVKKIKEEMFSTVDLYSLVSASTYDTAWLAMIPDSYQPNHPMFQGCLDWILNNQQQDGSWGSSRLARGEIPTLDCLPATLACMVSLKMWNIGAINVDKGLKFIHTNAENLLMKQHGCYPRWFAIVFPAMVELAHTLGLEVLFPEGLVDVVEDIFNERQRILEREELGINQHSYPPLIFYLEALPPSYDIDQHEILGHLSDDGSLFQSPSASAQAFMATGNKGCRLYLESVVQRCCNGVPPMYPMDEELVRLCMIDRLESLGLADHFLQEIEYILENVYRNYMNRESQPMGFDVVPIQLYKDSLAFRLLRSHGYHVSSWRFCWILRHNDIRQHIEENYEYFVTAMFNVYKSTNLMFLGEDELKEARSFSRKLLEKAISLGSSKEDNAPISQKFQKLIEHQLALPWLARLDHLEQRMCIEENETDGPWLGKASFYRLPSHCNDALLQLALENYTFRQSIYKVELEELKRWAKDSGLSDMGFGREKTTYCYFAVASSTSLPYDSDIRMLVAKSAIIVIVTDDFFDEEGLLEELKILTEAVKRWDGNGLSGVSKVIFDVLDDVVGDIATKYCHQQGHNITKILRDMWYQTFEAWLTEAKWSRSGNIPSIDEYLETGMISVAVHSIILPAACLMTPSIPKYTRISQYETITKLLMISSRLLNDIQSYQKEKKDGKTNLVLLYLKENPHEDIEDSIAYIRQILDTKKKELLEHILVDGISELPKSCRQLHLCCLKVFQMFYNSTNGFDSNTEMLSSINKAIYRPLEVKIKEQLLLKHASTPYAYLAKNSKRYTWPSFRTNGISWISSKGFCGGTKFIAPKFIV